MMNKIKIFFLFSIFSLSSYCLAQQIKIEISGISGKAVLYELSGENMKAIDSLTVGNGVYKFLFDNSRHPGKYRLSTGNNKSIDFIYDGEDVNLKTDASNIPDSLIIRASESNKVYYEFLKRNKAYKTKSELLRFILDRYPEKDNYYQSTKEKLIQLQRDYFNFVNVTSQLNPNSFVSKYIRSSQLPILDIESDIEDRLVFLKAHALDNLDFFDDELIYSDTFTNKTIEYLSYYRNPQLPLGLLEKEFITATDSILNKAKVNEIVYLHIVNYLLDGFKKFGFENVINYIVVNYVVEDNLCLGAKPGSTIDRRIDQAKNFTIGSVVPNIVIADSSGKLMALNKISSEQTLIVFYASWCPHCVELIPKISQLFQNQKKVKTQVLAVSIDSEKRDWTYFIKANKLSWINVSDLRGWDGQAASDYFLFATPTMFLVDNQQKLIAKPASISELRSWF